MNRASRTLFVFGVYLLILGPLLAIAPNLVLRLLRATQTHEPWLRVVGVLVLNLGIYYCLAARRGMREIVAASVIIRMMTPLWFLGFVLLASAPASLLLFAVADVAGALWTMTALRAERRAPAA